MLSKRAMKDRKLLIRVRCTTRKFYLNPPRPGRNDWHVRFTAPGINGTRRIFRNTGAKEIGLAKRIAAKIIESFWADAGRGADRLDCATTMRKSVNLSPGTNGTLRSDLPRFAATFVRFE